MELVWLAMMALCYHSASGMQMNAVNLRQQEGTHERNFCELHANISVAAKEICALLLDPHAVAQLKAYRELSIDEQATIDFEEYNTLQSELAKIDHIHKLVADEHLLGKLLKFQQFRERQRSEMLPVSRPRVSQPSRPRLNTLTSSLETKDNIAKVGLMSITPLCFMIPVCVLIVYFAFWRLGSALHHSCLQKEECAGMDGIRQDGIAKHIARVAPKELSSSEYYRDKCGKAFVAIIAVFFVIRTSFRVQNTDILQTSLTNVATCGREWCLAALLVFVVLYFARVVRERSLTKDKLEKVEKPRVRKKCKTCGSYSCYIRN